MSKETNQISIVKQADPQLFWEDLVAAAAQTTSQSLIVFVHGYNYGFNRTCRMAAEMQRALLGKATVIMISWPSNGQPADYLPDQVDLEWSVPFLASFLSKIADRIGPSNLQVLAHSMGSHQLNGHPRLGEAGEFLTVVDGIETIDVSPVGRYQILDHEYFYFHPGVAADLVLLSSSGARTAERPHVALEKTGWRLVLEDRRGRVALMRLLHDVMYDEPI